MDEPQTGRKETRSYRPSLSARTIEHRVAADQETKTETGNSSAAQTTVIDPRPQKNRSDEQAPTAMKNTEATRDIGTGTYTSEERGRTPCYEPSDPYEDDRSRYYPQQEWRGDPES